MVQDTILPNLRHQSAIGLSPPSQGLWWGFFIGELQTRGEQ